MKRAALARLVGGLTRRRFVGASLALLGVAAGKALALRLPQERRAPPDMPLALLDSVRTAGQSSKSEALLGRAWLAEHPEEANAAGLAEAVLASLGPQRRNRGRALERSLRARIRLDFEEENVVRLRGWILSRTEVRLWTLRALA